MGIKIFSGGDDTYSSLNPDPKRFEIKGLYDFNSVVLAEVKYLDCTNCDGMKLLVYKGIHTEDIRKLSVLDPHFDDNYKTISPIARFEYSPEGFDLAFKFCGWLRDRQTVPNADY